MELERCRRVSFKRMAASFGRILERLLSLSSCLFRLLPSLERDRGLSENDPSDRCKRNYLALGLEITRLIRA